MSDADKKTADTAQLGASERMANSTRCSRCQNQTLLSEWAITIARSCNVALAHRSEPPLRKSDIALCAECYRIHAKERELHGMREHALDVAERKRVAAAKLETAQNRTKRAKRNSIAGEFD